MKAIQHLISWLIFCVGIPFMAIGFFVAFVKRSYEIGVELFEDMFEV